MNFELHPRLAAGCFEIGKMAGCRLLLKDNALFSWFILVPEVVGIKELHRLDSATYLAVMLTQRRVCEFIDTYFQPEKLNLGCIGNQVSQLHLHLVGRSAADPAWPGTVWGFAGKAAYDEPRRQEIVTAARAFLELE